ncbi:DUF4062 domain-containing protein [Pseudoalteromonas luteoviolacea]|uniref:DUF4062 domain-containing protein n=1 Tax=Pseudoalteromonas luteoviolacea S4054 TaxID=1129367 RepID=A0A0F6A421_9GAMM|nr:DUF4062 domain-containing protein [Pseudoalteromonas luteoviolacea]KKE80962.1 hypothetical protein N479_23940 [Pseudoalteromonas luteoviolacea S4054]KZN74577.1 hypothetical protein N481_09135 [Pseudoalteromonas luteoviolacea S4047-1]
MDKRFQIFISSTFVDLIEERQAVLKSILEMDHMPAGMELFPAADDTAWNLIRDVIDASDYYVLIIGGRYGSLDEEGLSYTEKEYRYAVATKKAVIPLLHQNPDNLPRDKTETDELAWKKLKSFREEVENKHTCVYWSNADELKSKVIIGLTSTVKRSPAIGWVRADNVPSEATIKEVLSLKQKISELESELEDTRTTPPPGTEDLMQGEDSFDLEFTFEAVPPHGGWGDEIHYEATISPSWNDIFAAIAPVLINEATETVLQDEFRKSLIKLARDEYEDDEDLKGHRLKSFSFKQDDIYTCMIQLRALGLLKESDKKRSIRDTKTYWTLTPYGDQLMVQLRAISRHKKASRKIGSEIVESTEKDT